MIKEFAFGLSNRHHFQEVEKMGDWTGLDKDTFTSLYDYDEYVIEFYAKNKTLSGFDGLIYIPDEFILDVDGPETEKAIQRTIGLLILLKDINVPYNLYFSGRGFHVGIPSTAFRWRPDKELHLKVKDALTAKGIFEYADVSVTDKSRIIRLLNTKNRKSNLYKIYLTQTELHSHPEDIIKLARKPREIVVPRHECNPVFDVMVREKEAMKLVLKKKIVGR